jgi:hypothetical protein
VESSCIAGDTDQIITYDTQSGGSLFGHFLMDALAGRAADENGIVTVESAFEYVSKEMSQLEVMRGTVQRPALHSLNGLSTGFPLTAAPNSELGKRGKRHAILATSDRYHDLNLSGFSGEESLMRASAELLSDRGEFQVSLITGAQMTRANVIDQIMRVTRGGGPDDCLLFISPAMAGFREVVLNRWNVLGGFHAWTSLVQFELARLGRNHEEK